MASGKLLKYSSAFLFGKNLKIDEHYANRVLAGSDRTTVDSLVDYKSSY